MTTDHDFETTIPVRFRDIDAMGHVNNAVFATYLEQARADYFREVVGVGLTAVETVLASLTVDFQQPISPDQTVTVGLSVPDLGESSVPMEYEIRLEDGTVAATAETVQVVYDAEAERSRPIPTAWRTAIEST
ncbi:thioesterase family protein [Halococcus sp. IIIV-5B]|uniref:acyl-CoA thioesterase n=1 Tax=Halococcus sp. IIIV-5B TaxID=2321230 RepID=UPI000E72C2F2|nr:thioesterase family protein [Halococcus sp. IIIV-5B]RJT05478.1 acyl-CoA thioesterase [Halococcus sp. IIIV-5B]